MIVVSALLSPFTTPQSAAAVLSAWTASSLERIWEHSPAGPSRRADLRAAKDETYSFQIGLQSSSGTVAVNEVTTHGLSGPGGATISGSDIVLYREQYITVPALPAYLSGGPNAPTGAGRYPDGLIPFIDPETGIAPVGGSITAVPFNVVKGKNQALWVDVHVPLGAPAGSYSGTFTISGSFGSSAVSCTLQVWNFTLPRIPTLKSSVQSYHNRNDLMARELLRHRQSPAWSISSRRLESQYIDQYGLNSVSVFMGTGWYLGNCRHALSVSEPPASAYQAVYTAHDPRLLMYNFLADQVGPDHGCTGVYPTLIRWANDMHAAQRQLKAFLSVSPQPGPAVSSLYGKVDIWATLPIEYQEYRVDIRARIAAGEQVWLYNTLVSDNYSPKQNLNWGSLDWRLAMGYLMANVGLSGWQQWAVDCWGSDPWHSGTPGDCSNPQVPGDGMSMYPGKDVGLLGYAPSIRMKWSRDGINDYEYVEILKRLGDGTWAVSQIDRIAHDFANWTKDSIQLEAVRKLLGDRIDQLSGTKRDRASVPAMNKGRARIG